MAERTATGPDAPAVSIIVPTYNVARYLPQCLDALCAQTLQDLEIIVVNDGSTDTSGAIAHDYAARDSRVRVVDKPNSGYGASMNRGLAEARGTFVGLVEPDDYPDLAMFEKLYRAALRGGCDLVKCNFYAHAGGKDDIQWNLHVRGVSYGKVFCPADAPQVLCTAPAIWTGLYRRAFLEAEGIRFRETPGAAFQDTGFFLKTWFTARRAMVLRRPMLHYRMDNPGASSKTTDKVFMVCDEFADAEAFLRERPAAAEAFLPWLHVAKWGKYRWNYERIDGTVHAPFAERMHQEYVRAREAGELDLGLFDDVDRTQVERLLAAGPDAFAACYPVKFPAAWEVREAGAAGEMAFMADGVAFVGPAATAAAGKAVGVEGVQPVPEGPSPAVTVVVAAYNCGPFIGECLASLVAQTYGDFEAIVVDDASLDATLARAREAVGDDARFTFVERRENGGPGAARNQALDRAQGEYVMYVDADDYLAPDALEKLVRRARGQQLDELYFSARSFYEGDGLVGRVREDFSARDSFEGVATGRELFTFFEQRGQFFAQGALRLVRRALLEEHGIRFPEGIVHEDVLYIWRALVVSERSSFLNEPIYQRRLRPGSIMGAKRRTAENVRGHYQSVREVRAWVAAHAGELDDAFVASAGRQAGHWCRLVAEDWEDELDDLERKAFLASLPEGEREYFLFDVLGMGGAAARAADEYRDSRTYRFGDALLSVPRFARDHLQAAAGRLGR